MKKHTGKFWIYILAILVFYLTYQLFFTWDENFDNDTNKEIIPEDQVVFLTITEKFYGIKKPSFDSLLESLETWSFDRKDKEVFLKFDTQLPKDNTQAMVVYDRGFDSFEKYSEVFSITTFPYNYEFNDKPFLTVYHITEEGTIYLNFDGKKIKLDPNDSHYNWSFEGFQLSKFQLTNHGLYDKSQFQLMK